MGGNPITAWGTLLVRGHDHAQCIVTLSGMSSPLTTCEIERESPSGHGRDDDYSRPRERHHGICRVA